MTRRTVNPFYPIFFVPAMMSQYPPAQNDTYVKASSSYWSGVTGFTWWQYYATNPANSLIGPGSPWGNEGNWGNKF